jgi:hypothetical protein
VIDAVAAWIAAHPVVDFLLQLAVGGLATVTFLGSACGAVYLALFLRRLLSKANRDRFVNQPIPQVTGGEFWGAKIGLEAAREISAAEQGTVDALKGLNDRVATLEEALQRAEAQIGGGDG